MKKIIVLFIALLVANHLQAQKKFTVKGSFKNYEGKVYLFYGSEKDSVYTNRGSFTFEGVVGIPAYSSIQVPTTETKIHVTDFWIDGGETLLEMDTAFFRNNRFSGMEVNARLLKAGKAQQIMHAYRRQSNEIWASSLSELDKKKKLKEITDKILNDHPNSILSVYALSSKLAFYDKKDLQNFYTELDSSLANTRFGRDIKHSYKSIRKVEVKVGEEMPNFSQQNQFGKIISLANFKGKYTLVDFWASWCIPCRKENPAVVEAYKKFQNKGFDILAISLDDKFIRR
ncbi:MAG: AhpC/TSA family protein [Pedobacter sp.]|nr:MAG: AhpC/TSA family protein [Pedobacter sp.]